MHYRQQPQQYTIAKAKTGHDVVTDECDAWPRGGYCRQCCRKLSFKTNSLQLVVTLQPLYDPFQSGANYQLSLKRKPEDTDWRKLINNAAQHNGSTIANAQGAGQPLNTGAKTSAKHSSKSKSEGEYQLIKNEVSLCFDLRYNQAHISCR